MYFFHTPRLSLKILHWYHGKDFINSKLGLLVNIKRLKKIASFITNLGTFKQQSINHAADWFRTYSQLYPKCYKLRTKKVHCGGACTCK